MNQTGTAAPWRRNTTSIAPRRAWTSSPAERPAELCSAERTWQAEPELLYPRHPPSPPARIVLAFACISMERNHSGRLRVRLPNRLPNTEFSGITFLTGDVTWFSPRVHIPCTSSKYRSIYELRKLIPKPLTIREAVHMALFVGTLLADSDTRFHV